MKYFIRIITFCSVLVVIILSCEKDEEQVNIPPSAEFISTIYEITNDTKKEVIINVTDKDGKVILARYFIDNVGVGSSTSSPYRFELNTSTLGVGYHKFKAIAYDDDKETSEITFEFEIKYGKPIVDFRVSNSTLIQNETIRFTDLSTNEPESWDWDFGDGNTSSIQNPTHQYADSGTYTVSLVCTNSSGSNTETKTDFIKVNKKIITPTAAFLADKTSIVEGELISFTDQSTNNPTSWDWDFGDGNTSNVQNPSHTYNTTGLYTIKLSATNSSGTDIEIKNNYINVSKLILTPVANFVVDKMSITEGETVSFTNQSTNNPTSWNWDFGDESSSTIQNPSHTYTKSGTYTIKLSATNSSGTDIITKTNYINVSELVITPVANFFADKTSITEGESVSFTDQSTNNPTSWNWDFGDGSSSTVQNPSHTFNVAGTYTVMLSATNSSGTDTESKLEYIIVNHLNADPIADYTFSPSEGDINTVFELNASTSSDNETPDYNLKYRWDFDGDNIWDTEFLSNTIISHTYENPGSYSCLLEVTDEDGGVDITTKTIKVSSWAVFNISNSEIPTHDINCIAIQSDNTIWLGTKEHGLIKYDGNNFVAYNTSNSGIVSDWITKIVIDDDDNLWFTGLGKDYPYIDYYGLGKFDGTTFYNYNTLNSDLPHNTIHDIKCGSYYTMLATHDGIAILYDDGWKILNDQNTDLPNNQIMGINGTNTYILCTPFNSGVCKLTLTYPNTEYDMVQSLPSSQGFSENKLYTVYRDAMVYIKSLTDKYAFNHSSLTWKETSIPGMPSFFIYDNKHGRWGITDDKTGIWQSAVGGAIYNYNSSNTDLIETIINGITYDSEHHIWLATEDGVIMFW